MVTLRWTRQVSCTNHSTLANCALASGCEVASEYELTDPMSALANGWFASNGLLTSRPKLKLPLNWLLRAAGRVVYSKNRPPLSVCAPTTRVRLADEFQMSFSPKNG